MQYVVIYRVMLYKGLLEPAGGGAPDFV